MTLSGVRALRVPGGIRIRGYNPEVVVGLTQVPKRDRLHPQVAYPHGTAVRVEQLFPGQHLRVQNARVSATLQHGEPLRLATQSCVFYVLRAQGVFRLCDAPILLGATNSLPLHQGARIPVQKGLFGSGYWGIAGLPDRPFMVGLDPEDGNVLVEELGLDDGLKVSYVCGGSETINPQVISRNLEMLWGDAHVLAGVTRLIPRYPGKPTRTLRLLIDPRTGTLTRYVSWFDEGDRGVAGVKLVQNVDSRKISYFSFYPKGKQFPSLLWYVMEATVSFYNRYRAS